MVPFLICFLVLFIHSGNLCHQIHTWFRFTSNLKSSYKATILENNIKLNQIKSSQVKSNRASRLSHLESYFCNKVLTVAGEATSKSIGSKIKFVVEANWMISPLFKQSWKKLFKKMSATRNYSLKFYFHCYYMKRLSLQFFILRKKDDP